MSAVDDLLLFRSVDPSRRAVVARLLDDGVGAGGWRHEEPIDLWELYDAGSAPAEGPVAVAATSEPDRGQRVSLVAIVVAAPQRGRGIGIWMIQELSDALRARGVLALAATVPNQNGPAIAVLHRAGFRLSGIEQVGGVARNGCTMCFHLEL